jgi:glycosyltransferase involved in cell wall biosynthesis
MLSIAICTYNRAELLRGLLDCLVEAIPQSTTEFEVLVINNNSNDSTSNLLSQYIKKLPLTVYSESNQGLAHARNRALKEFSGDAILFFDDDVLVDKLTLEIYVAALSTYSGVGYFGGPIEVDWQGNKPHWLSKEKLPLLEGMFGVYDHGEIDFEFSHEKTNPYGANFMLRRSVVDLLCEFNSDLGVKGEQLGRGEETDYFSRASQMNVTGMYLADARVKHRFQLERISILHLYRYGVAKGVSLVELDQLYSERWIYRYVNMMVRSVWQLLRGRRAFFYQCVINMGIIRGQFRHSKISKQS